MLDTFLKSAALAVILATPAAADPLRAFDVAEDMSRFVFAAAPVHDDGMPDFGNFFVTQGYIYPSGTLDGGIEGTNADGSPAFPELVLGTWTCDGVFVGKGMYTETGTILISRQVFQFANGDILVSQGPEIVDAGVAIDRPITGATGEYTDISDSIQQVMLGMSDGYGVRLQFEIGDHDSADATVRPDGDGGQG